MIPLAAIGVVAKNWKPIGAGVLIVLVLAEAGAIRKLHGDLSKARLVLENPKTVEVVKVVRVEGPVRTKTVVIERPTGERETTTTEERAEVREATDSSLLKEPVPFDSLITPDRKFRLLAGLDLRGFDYRDAKRFTGYGGVSIGNRIDVLAGLGKREHWESHVMVVARF